MESELAYIISSNTPVKLPHFSNISNLLGRSRAFYQHLLHQHLLRTFHHLGCFQQS